MMSIQIESCKAQPALVLGEIGLVHNLAKTGIPIIVGSEIHDNPSLYSRYTKRRVMFSDYRSDVFIEELCDFGKSMRQKMVLFTDDDHAVLNIAKNQKRLCRYYLFAFPTSDIVEKLHDKQLFAELAEEHNLPVPKGVTLSSPKDLKKIREKKLRYPCIIKPSFKQAWWDTEFGEKVGPYQKAIVCDNYGSLIKKYRQIARINPHVVVQEYVSGSEDEIYSVNMLVGSDGDLIASFIARKLRTYPVSAGEGSYIVTVKDDEMREMAIQIVGTLGLSGLLNIQFKRDSRTKKPVLLEIHTRNSVWSYLGTASGVNLSRLYYNYITGREIDWLPDCKEGVSIVFLEKDIKALLQNMKQHQLEISILNWIRSYFKNNVIQGYKWDDPLPILMKLWFILRRRLHINNGIKQITSGKQSELNTPQMLN